MAFLIVLFFLINVVLVPVMTVIGSWYAFPALAGALLSGRLIFKDSMNLVQNVGPVYWIIRDNGSLIDPIVCRGFMRQVTAPWLIGQGIQFRLRRHTFQIGMCFPQPADDETEGVLNAVGGRYMEESPEEIGVWR